MSTSRFIRRLRAPLALALFTLALLLAVLPAAAHVPRAAAPDFAAIDAYVESERRAMRIPGLALGIVQGDRIVHLRGFGTADPSGSPVTAQTPFFIGSTTKSFTALAVLQLVEQGKLDLDTPVQRYLPAFRFADAAASAQITVRHLLNQTSGLSQAAGNSDLTTTDVSDTALEQRMRTLRTKPLSRSVGSTFLYSNANYDLLGLLVQTISGQSYEQYMEQHIFAPLDMRHSFTAPSAALPHGLATGYHYWFGHPTPTAVPYPRGSLPSGYLISTAEDMAHYLSAQLNGGRYGSATVLSAAGIATLHRPAVTAFAGHQYGMGWFIGPTSGIPSVWHNGTTPGFNAKMVLIPDRRLGVVLLMNASSQLGMARMEGIADGVSSLMLGQQPVATPTNPAAMVIFSVILGIVALQVVGMIRSVRVLRRWRVSPERRPYGWRRAWDVGVPGVLNLLVALLLLLGTQQLFGNSLAAVMLLSPDIGTLLIGGGGVALTWGILRTALAILVLRETGARRIAIAPANV